LTTLVENFPGFRKVSTVGAGRKHEAAGGELRAEYVHGAVLDTDFRRGRFRLNIESEWTETRTVIIASGARRGVGPGIRAQADWPRRQLLRHLRRLFLPRQKIMVVGAAIGDEEANFLTRFAGIARASARRIPRVQDHAGSRAAQSEDQILLDTGGRSARCSKHLSPAVRLERQKGEVLGAGRDGFSSHRTHPNTNLKGQNRNRCRGEFSRHGAPH